MNLFKKTTATIALVALVSGIFSAGVSASSATEIEAANALAANGYINDHSSDIAAYNLSQNVLRQEIAAVARGIAGLAKKTSCDNSFSDVSATTPNTWACSSVEALLDADLIAANTMFNPEATISKAEAVGMMVKAAFGSEYAYDSSKSTSWQEQVVGFAVSKGVVANFSNYDTAATRGFVFESGNNADVASDETAEACDEVSQLLGLCDDTVVDDTTDDDTTVVVNPDAVVTVELSPETPNSNWVAANTPRTDVLAFDVTAGSEDVTLDEVRLDYTGLSDYADVDNVSLYMGANKISKGTDGKDFNDKYIEISFENDTVIMAGETKTIFVTATLAGGVDNVSHQITMTDLVASTTVEMSNISSTMFNVVTASNVSELDLNIDEVTGADITVGETIKLADFDLREENDNEDVLLKSMTFLVAGSMDHQDDISDIVLYADGEEVASNLTVNSDEEIVIALDYTIAADSRVNFELKAIITGSVTEDLSAELTEVYATGVETRINTAITDNGVAFDYANDGSTAELRTIEGSEINVAFDKSDLDEARPNAEEVLVGNLKLSTYGEYNMSRIEVSVTSTVAVNSLIQKLELDGRGFDSDDSGTGTTKVFYFDDITLNNEALDLPLTFDVYDTVALDGESVTFAVKILNIEDEANNEKYEDGGAGSSDINNILSTNALDDNTIDIATATFTLGSTAINDKIVVLGNGVETIIYKAKINVGDADTVTLRDFNLVENAATTIGGTGTIDLNDILDSATLNIGGQTFTADIDADSIDFSTSLDIDAGSDNVEVLVTVILKDNDAVTSGEIVAFEVDTTALANDVEDSDGNALAVGNLVVNTANTNIAMNELLEEGTFSMVVLNDVDTDDNVENTVLAGSDSVTLAEIELEAEYEDVKVKELTFTLSGTGDLSTTLENVRLVSGGTTIADGSIVTFDGTGTTVTFKNDFTISDDSNLVEAELVADINRITGAGDATSAVAADLIILAAATGAIDSKGVSSNNDLVADVTGSTTSETVAVVPTKLNFSVVEALSSGTAKIQVTADSGDNTVGTNDQVPEVLLNDLIYTDLGSGTGYTIYKDGNAAGNQATFAALSAADRTFDGDASITYIFVPAGAVDTTHTMVLSGDVADYDVQDSDGNTVSAGLITTLDSDISVGTISY